MSANTSQKKSAPRRAKTRSSKRPVSIESQVDSIREELGEEWPPSIYRERILTLRTRSHALPYANKNAHVEIFHTLLGIELKVGRRRVSCPDLATARYLRVFVRAGVANVAVPYDITKISRLADDLESAWQRMLLLADRRTESQTPQARARLRSAAVKEVKREIEEAGAGTPVPKFKQSTRQRPARIQAGEK